jgi:hypothetical protein
LITTQGHNTMSELSLFIPIEELQIELKHIAGCRGDRETPPTRDWAEVKTIHYNGQNITHFILSFIDEDDIVQAELDRMGITAEEL